MIRIRLRQVLGWLGLIVCVAMFPPTTPAAPNSSPLINIGEQPYQGLWSTSHPAVAEFRGIPFARPPVGDLRWRPPRPLRTEPGAAAGPLPATRFAPACMQGDGGVEWYIDVAAAFGQAPDVVERPLSFSEDCLYLNIWSPQLKPGANLPVMVFVHGGGNANGWSYEPNYLGAALAGRGVVVVTTAYRLGPLGFFSHPALDNGPGEPVANFALLDLRAAFQWVRQHAESFGGDPGNVTAFGESAGAFNLVDLLLADLAAGSGGKLSFDRLISQSIGGSLSERQNLEQEQGVGRVLAAEVGLGPTATAADLRAVPAGRWIAAAQTLPEEYYPDAVIDGLTLTQEPLRAIERLRADGVELILGTNADEWLMYIEATAGAQELDDWIATRDNPEALRASLADLDDPRRALDRLETFLNMVCPSRRLADWANANGGRAWIYRFTRQRPGPGGERLGAYHGTELPYVFGTHDEWLPTADADHALTGKVMAYWTRFANSGNPNGPGLPYWPSYAAGQDTVMELGGSVGAVKPDWPDLCDLLGPA